MKYFLLSLTFTLSVFSDGTAQSQNIHLRNSTAVNADNLVTSVIDDTYRCEFENAINGANELIKILPEEPQGYFYKGGVFRRMMEEGCLESNDSTMRVVRSLIDKACKLSEQKCNTNSNDVMAHFYYAASLVYRAWYESRSHDWIAVMSDGIKAKKMLEKAVEIDPNFYDGYAGIGAFNCYAARLPWYLKPFAAVVGVSGDEDKGIEQLKKAAQFGKYSKTEAALFLGSVVYQNREDYSNAVKFLLELHQEFPQNFYISQYLCRAYYELQNYSQVVSVADAALASGDHDGPCQKERLSFIQLFRGKAYEQLDKKDKAVADYEAIVKLDGDRFAGKEAKAALDRLEN